MRHKTKWLLSISFILLAFSACQPGIQLDEDDQSTQQPETTTITQSPSLKTVQPSLTPHPLEEPTMTTIPTNQPISTPTDEPANAPTDEPASQPTGEPASEPADPSTSLQLFPPDIQNWIDHAQEDLARRLGIATTEIELVSYESKEWSDSSLGCPQPDMKYAQVPQDGFLIILAAGDSSYNYHGGGSRPPFLCQQIPQTIKKPPPISLLTPTISVPPPRD
jgi:hypothetical protein